MAPTLTYALLMVSIAQAFSPKMKRLVLYGQTLMAFQIGLPSDTEKLRQVASGFTRCTNSELFGCVSAIDGWTCKTHKPHQSEVGDVMAYRYQHGCWGLVVLAGCDADCHYNIFSLYVFRFNQ